MDGDDPELTAPHRGARQVRRMGRAWIKVAAYLWASPNTLLGLLVGGTGLVTGGAVQRVGGILEFHGGTVSRLLNNRLICAQAMTLGHVVLGRDATRLEACRAHELVHVRQYERWGPFFLPAYLGSSVVLWFRGRHVYLDNPFEVEAFEETDPRPR